MTDSPYAADACPGPCNRRYRQAVDDHQTALVIYEQALAAYEDAYARWTRRPADSEDAEPVAPEPPDEPTVPHTLADPVWCSRCAGTIRRALANLDDLASLLESWSDGHRGATSGTKIGGASKGSGSPSPIGDVLDSLYGMLTLVEDQWREHRHYPERPNRPRDSRARRLTIGFLLGELYDILDNRGSVRFGLGVLAWERRLQAMSTSEPVVQRRTAVRCPRCRERALRTRDDGYTQCAECGRLLSEEEYQELVDEQDGAGRTQEAIGA